MVTERESRGRDGTAIATAVRRGSQRRRWKTVKLKREKATLDVDLDVDLQNPKKEGGKGREGQL
jgi:hypothetical protein